MKIYLVAGKSGSGKGKVAEIIKEYYTSVKKKAIVTDFSKYLKMYAKEVLNWDGKNPKPRKFLQDLGVTIRENMDKPKMLINRLMDDIDVYKLYFDAVIISDVRLPLEIEEFRKAYGEDVSAIYVINQFGKSELTVEEQAHVTETALENYSKFDITITNDNINMLDNKVLAFLESREL